MDHDMIDFDIGLGVGGDVDGVDIENAVDYDDVGRSPPAPGSFSGAGGVGEVYIPEGDLQDLEPFEGMEFESEEAAKAFYNSYARRVGFSTRVSSSRRSRKDGAIIQRQFVCAKEGFRNLNERRMKDRELKRPRTVTRVGCKASLSVKIQESGQWVVSGFVKEHNHELVPPDQVHCLRSHRQISGPAKTLIDTLQAAGMGPRRIMAALIKEYGGISQVGFTEVDCRNYIRNNRLRSMDGDLQLLLDYVRQMHNENPAFFYAVQSEEDQNMSNVFWVDPKARTNFTYFSDTVIFDTTYRSNRYRLPFATFTGVNHHGQPVLFGCAFLVNETEASFVWLFKTWLMAMSGHHPGSITTNHDPIIQSALSQVFPQTRHRFCKWHIFKKCQEMLSQVFLEHPAFEAEFHKCVNLSDSIDEFESCWLSLVNRYELRDNDWLQSIYSDRKQWVPVYLRDSFFAEISITQCSDSMNSYFDGYVNASTSLNHFFKLYEKAIESRNEKEIKADFETVNTPPSLKTPSPIEKHLSELYTRKLFARFQEELVGTLTFTASKVEDNGEALTYQVVKFGEDHKAHYVSFNALEMKATCSCQMFEFSGLLCRHVLAVFRVTNVMTIPSHYILKRWTKNAKSSIMLEVRSNSIYTNYLESHTVRYNTLRHEAFKFVSDGAKTSDTYKVAVDALKEALKKVSDATMNEGRYALPNGRTREGSVTIGSQSSQLCDITENMTEDDLDKKIQQLTTELEYAKKKCEVYRSSLQSVCKDIADHRHKLSIKVQSIKTGLQAAFEEVAT